MFDLLNKNNIPSLEEIETYVKNPVFTQFCEEIKNTYQCREKIEFSSCSWIKGWNIKFKKSGRTLCTIYPKEFYFTVMIVISQKEKETFLQSFSDFTSELQEIYQQTQKGNGQKWLLIDLEDKEELYYDVMRLIQIRRESK